jgi:hypothetical protein
LPTKTFLILVTPNEGTQGKQIKKIATPFETGTELFSCWFEQKSLRTG